MKTKNNVGEIGDPYSTPQMIDTSTGLWPTTKGAIVSYKDY